jgi:hypothetical protein
MLALTLWRPWDHAILYGGKRIENRRWRPWENIINQRIALHAGMKYDTEGAEWMIRQKLYTPPAPSESIAGAIVGTAIVTGYVRESDDPWFIGCDQQGSLEGGYGWLLADVVALEAPVICRGAQGLWKVPEGLLEGTASQVVPPTSTQMKLFE